MFYQRNEVVIVDLTCVFLDFRIIGGNSRLTQMCLVLGNDAISRLSFNNNLQYLDYIEIFTVTVNLYIFVYIMLFSIYYLDDSSLV